MKQKEKIKNTLLDLLLILSGCVFYGWSMVYLAGLPTIPGNLMGIATVCNTLFGWPTGIINLILSVPTLIFGTIILGKRMLCYTAITMTALSLLTDLFLSLFTWDSGGNYLFLTIFSASIMGFGCGLIMYAGATTGGTTIIGRLLNRKFPRVSVGSFLIFMDAVILVGGAIALQDAASLFYSLIFEIICCKIIDLVLFFLHKFLSPRW